MHNWFARKVLRNY